MELLKSILLTAWYIISFLVVIVYTLLLMFIIDVYVLGWFGLPTERGIGIGVVLGFVVFGVLTAAVHFSRMIDKELAERKEYRRKRLRDM